MSSLISLPEEAQKGNSYKGRERRANKAQKDFVAAREGSVKVP